MQDPNCIQPEIFCTQIWILNVDLNHKTKDRAWPQTLSLDLVLEREPPSLPSAQPLAGVARTEWASYLASPIEEDLRDAELHVQESHWSCFSPSWLGHRVSSWNSVNWRPCTTNQEGRRNETAPLSNILAWSHSSEHTALPFHAMCPFPPRIKTKTNIW